MYIPVKQICNKFPEWLAIQEDHLPKEEYERYIHHQVVIGFCATVWSVLD